MQEKFSNYERTYDGKYIIKYQICNNDRYETYLVVKDNVISVEHYKNGELELSNNLAFLQDNAHMKV